MSLEIFRKANRLWFREGRTAVALQAYEEALRAAPADPVAAFQLARVLWSLDRFSESHAALERAFAHRDALSPAGHRLLENWRRRFQHGPPQRYFPEFPPELLDRDRLEAGAIPAPEWRTLADAAASREMYGLAVYALRRWNGKPIDAEDARDIGKIETNRDMQEAMLADMRADHEPRKKIVTERAVIPTPETRDFRRTLRSNEELQTPLSDVIPSEHSESSMLPELPLNLSLSVSPSEGPAGVTATVVARLSNPTDAVQVVNSRMLVNHVGLPGEIWLDVQGPPGYRNSVGYRVNAGETPDEFFVSLMPDAAIEQSWTLNDYESIDSPGEYVITLTYHNEDAYAPDGRPMAVGKVSAATRYRRSS